MLSLHRKWFLVPLHVETIIYLTFEPQKIEKGQWSVN